MKDQKTLLIKELFRWCGIWMHIFATFDKDKSTLYTNSANYHKRKKKVI